MGDKHRNIFSTKRHQYNRALVYNSWKSNYIMCVSSAVQYVFLRSVRIQQAELNDTKHLPKDFLTLQFKLIQLSITDMSRQISTDCSNTQCPFNIMQTITLLVGETVNKSRLFRLLYYLINCKVLDFSRRPLETLESDATSET